MTPEANGAACKPSCPHTAEQSVSHPQRRSSLWPIHTTIIHLTKEFFQNYVLGRPRPTPPRRRPVPPTSSTSALLARGLPLRPRALPSPLPTGRLLLEINYLVICPRGRQVVWSALLKEFLRLQPPTPTSHELEANHPRRQNKAVRSDVLLCLSNPVLFCSVLFYKNLSTFEHH